MSWRNDWITPSPPQHLLPSIITAPAILGDDMQRPMSLIKIVLLSAVKVCKMEPLSFFMWRTTMYNLKQ